MVFKDVINSALAPDSASKRPRLSAFMDRRPPLNQVSRPPPVRAKFAPIVKRPKVLSKKETPRASVGSRPRLRAASRGLRRPFELRPSMPVVDLSTVDCKESQKKRKAHLDAREGLEIERKKRLVEGYTKLCDKVIEEASALNAAFFPSYFGAGVDQVLEKMRKAENSDLSVVRREIKLEELSRKLSDKKKTTGSWKSKVEKRLEELFEVEECFEKEELLDFIAKGAAWKEFLLKSRRLCSPAEIAAAVEKSRKRLIFTSF